MRKASFLNNDRPLLCVMVQDATADAMIDTINNALYEGAEAFGIQLEWLDKEFRTEEHLRSIFSACRGLPIYITSYRKGRGIMTDEECKELLLLGARCGATLCDVMGDMYDPVPNEITFDEIAVEKQKALIKEIHALGCEALMSTHLHGLYEKEDVYKYAKAQRERGVDVVKIVNFARTEEELIKNIEICAGLKCEIDCEYLYLANGEYCRLLRQIGGKLGCCMYLCVVRYGGVYSKEQTLLRSQKSIRDNMVL